MIDQHPYREEQQYDTPSHFMPQRNDTLRLERPVQLECALSPTYNCFKRMSLFLLFSLIGRELAWQFLQDNWDELYNRYASGLLLPRLIQVNRQTPEKFTRVQVKVFVLSNETLYVQSVLSPKHSFTRYNQVLANKFNCPSTGNLI